MSSSLAATRPFIVSIARLTLVLVVGAALSCERPAAHRIGRETALSAPAAPSSTPDQPGPVMQIEETDTLVMQLSDAPLAAAPVARTPVAPAEPLAPEEAAVLLERLPPLTDPHEGDDLSLPEASRPAPRTGDEVETPFPPPGELEPPTLDLSGPLRVERYAPEGPVDLAPHVSVTFDRPMVALSSADGDPESVPLVLAPRLPGRWRWVGARTLLFELDGRLPMATRFEAYVPAGTPSADGGVLEQEVRWSFETPPPSIESFWPEGGPRHTNTVMVIVFDQRVDPEVVAGKLVLQANGVTRDIVMAVDEDLDAFPEARARVKRAREGRWLAFRAREELPLDSQITVTLPEGLPSAEGPRVTESPQTREFRTYSTFRVVDARCPGECRPGAAWTVRFTNPLCTDSFREDEHIRIEPELPMARIHAFGSTLSIQGLQAASTTYQVHLSTDIEDVFGQSLEPHSALRFDVGAAHPRFLSHTPAMAVLDPSAPPAHAVHTQAFTHLLVTAHSVEPSDWPDYIRWLRGQTEEMPGKRAFHRRIEISDHVSAVSTVIPLEEALREDLGHVVLRVEGHPMQMTRWRSPELRVWLQRTRIGLMAWQAEALDVFALAMDRGEPLAGATLSLLDPEGKDYAPEVVETDESGRATLALRDQPASLLIARHGDDTAFLAHEVHRGERWVMREPRDRALFYVTNDRGIYQPGERVQFKGWVRVARAGPDGDLESAPSTMRSLRWKALDPRGSELATGTTELDAFGGFEVHFDIPGDANLGWASLVVETTDGPIKARTSASFQVQEFRRPEFEVEVSSSQAPHILGEPVTATVSARYYTGEPLPGAEVTWMVSSRRASFVPPGHERFSFGRAPLPWGRMAGPRSGAGQTIERHQGLTTVTGEHALEIETVGGPPFAASVSAQASVMDVNRQAWAASTDLLVHPAAIYVGLATERRFIHRGEDLEVESIVVDLDGKVAAGRDVTLTAERVGWRLRGGEWTMEVEETRTAEVTSADDSVSTVFRALEGGRWRVIADVSDKRGRRSRTEIDMWVSGSKEPPRVDRVEREEVTLIADKTEYAPGETARILARVPFYPAEMVFSLRRDGTLSTEHVRVEGPDHTIEIELVETMTPGLHVHAAVVGTAPRVGADGDVSRELPPRPAYGYGSTYLSIPPAGRTLSVEAEADEAEVGPGEDATITVAVKDSQGSPVANAQVLLVVVDEAVLALTGHRLPDPVELFYPTRSSGVTDTSLYQHVLLGDPEVETGSLESTGSELRDEAMGLSAPRALAKRAPPAPPLGESPSEPAGAPIELRRDMRPLALFAPSVVTGPEGKAQVTFTLPDSLTRYRIMAVATDGGRRFGKGDSSLTARLALMVRPSLPRFLNLGDEAELPFVIQNQTKGEMSVALAARSVGIALHGETPGLRLQVPAGDRVEVRLPASAGRAGPAKLQIAISAGSLTDAAEVELPVLTPVTAEAFATYGTLDSGALRQPVSIPPGARTDFGALEITTSSTELQALTDAVVYLANFPFDCTEQIASRVIALAALVDVLSAFEAEGLPPPGELREAVQRDVRTLADRQGHDGGFGLWRRPGPGDHSWPYVTLHATLALVLASEKGFEVQTQARSLALRYLREIERYIPDWYPKEVGWSIRASALYVLHRAGMPDTGAARALLAEAGLRSLNLDAVGWLLAVLASEDASLAPEVAEMERHLLNRLTETAAGATFASSYDDGAHLIFHSSRRTDAVVLEGLMAARPQSDLIVKIVRGLLAHRVRGHWSNTQENGWVLLALDGYFRRYEGVTPAFVARAWLEDTFVGEHRFAGRTTERQHVRIPMQWLAREQEPGDVILAKEGAGRLYYRLGLRYVPDDLQPEPVDRGFTVERSYEAVDNPADVRREDDGTWRVRAGASVRVRLTLVAPARRYHVALVDRMPAGFEPMNPALAVTGSLPPEAQAERAGGRFWNFWRTWFEHQNLRDDRAEAFASLLWAGVHEYSYVARATTPGRFLAPPPTVEEMYHPETHGRGRGEVVVIEEL